MTLDEIRKQKEQAEVAISRALDDFTKASNLSIARIDLEMMDITRLMSEQRIIKYTVSVIVEPKGHAWLRGAP